MINGKQVLNDELIGLFQADEGGIESYTGGIGEGKTYGACKRAVDDLMKGKVVYTSWPMILDHFEGDQRKDPFYAFWNLVTFRKRFFKFDLKKNWHYIDYEDEKTWYIDYKDKPLHEASTFIEGKHRVYFDDFVEFITYLTDCVVYLDEGQDIFDSYEGTKMSKKREKYLQELDIYERRLLSFHKDIKLFPQQLDAMLRLSINMSKHLPSSDVHFLRFTLLQSLITVKCQYSIQMQKLIKDTGPVSGFSPLLIRGI